jgi:glucosamine kinase
VNKNFDYLIGVDGGGTGTRVLVMRPNGDIIAKGHASASGLTHGIERAWSVVLEAIHNAFTSVNMAMPELSVMAIGLGLAGVHNKVWATQFEAQNPGFSEFILATDGYTTLLGAHGGKAGAILAAGTGSIGEVLLPDGCHKEVGGWGFPSGDEASGAWLGLQAINYAQQVLDGRTPSNPFSQAVIDFCGGSKDAVFAWLGNASQTNYAQLAPLVIEFAKHDTYAETLMQKAGIDLAKMAQALDPSASLPIALCGGLAQALREYLPDHVLQRVVSAQADSAHGALLLLKTHLQSRL